MINLIADGKGAQLRALFLELGASVGTIYSLWLLSYGLLSGFIFGAISNLLWILWAVSLKRPAFGIWFVNIALLVINIRGFHNG